MKKSLLLLMGLVLTFVGAKAQWEEPTTASDLVSGHVYKVRNVQASQGEMAAEYQYLAGGTSWYSWATSTVLTDYDNCLYFTISETEDGWVLQRTSDDKYTFISGTCVVDGDSLGEMHVDQGSQAAVLHFFDIVKQEETGYYRIKATAANNTYVNPDKGFWGWPLNDEEVPNAVYACVSDETAYGLDWEFIDYTAYNVAVELGELIAEAEAGDYASVLADDIAAAKAVYNDTTSTPEALQAAYDTLKMAMNYATIKGASEDNPKDATGFLVNPAFDNGVTGWTVGFVSGTNATNVGYQSASYTNGDVTINGFIEAWAAASTSFNPQCSHRAIGDAELSQTMLSLPAGKYSFACDAISSYQDDATEEVYGTYLFARCGETLFKTTVGTGNGVPEHFNFTFVNPSDGDVVIGLMTDNTNANWIAADNFELWYYGEYTEDPNKAVLDALIKECETAYPDLDDVHANADVKDAYSQVLDASKSCSSEYVAQTEALQAAKKALDTSVAEYKTLLALIEKATEKTDEFEGGKWAEIATELGDLIMEWQDAYDEGSATSEDIAAYQAAYQKTIVDGITRLMEAGDEVTMLIDNPSYDTGFSGWTTSGATPAWGGISANTQGSMAGVEMTSGNAEVYHAAFDMYQVIHNMPKGSFTVTCQAFERNDDGYAAYWAQGPEAGITGVLYVNQTEKKLNNILAYASEVQIFSDGTWWDDASTDYGYIPNGMPGANYHFNNPDNPTAYINKVNITLQEAGDSITIGIKTTGTNSWILWDNFRLVYNGAGADAYYEQIDELVAQLQAVFDEAELYGADAETMVNEAITALQTARQSADADVCIAALAQGEEALAYAKASITAYNEFDAQVTALGEALETYAETADAEALQTASDLLDVVQSVLDAKSATNDEVEAYLTQIAAAITGLKLPAGYKDATEESPVDFTSLIINPTFDTVGDFTGWGGSGFAAGGTTAACAERYAMNFDTYQIINGLPAGYYVVGVDGFYRRGSVTNDYNIHVANPDSCLYTKLYATGDETVETSILPIAAGATNEMTATSWGDGLYVPNSMAEFVTWNEAGFYKGVQVIAHLSEAGALTIGVKKETLLDTDWSIFDNFTLTYLGTTAPTGVETIEAAEPVKIEGIYNLAGQKVNTMVRGGIYIINGKKVLF